MENAVDRSPESHFHTALTGNFLVEQSASVGRNGFNLQRENFLSQP
jgi:hypothetical protein